MFLKLNSVEGTMGTTAQGRLLEYFAAEVPAGGHFMLIFMLCRFVMDLRCKTEVK